MAERLTEDQIKMLEEPLQDLKNLADPLEPLKVVSALKSQCMVLDFRKKNKPKDISPLDHSIIAALWKQVPRKVKDRSKIKNEAGVYIGFCPECETGNSSESAYCYKCGQRLYWVTDEETEVEEDGTD